MAGNKGHIGNLGGGETTTGEESCDGQLGVSCEGQGQGVCPVDTHVAHHLDTCACTWASLYGTMSFLH